MNVAIGIGQLGISQSLIQKKRFKRVVVLQVTLVRPTFGSVKRRLGDVKVPTLHQFAHLAEKERQQQRPDMRSVHVGVRHDDDAVVAQLASVETALLDRAGSDAGAKGGN